jgi:GTP-binding protein LepA
MISFIRNFCIIAHIDHGKSTLADRFLEVTKTVDKRNMQSQYLDQLELERERGITIKMAPVRMTYNFKGENYTLNLIDTPGHSDFSYEVSRALHAVEGGILLVDITSGIQAQTLSHFYASKEANLKLIGAINKIDVLDDFPQEKARKIESLKKEISSLTGLKEEEIICVSGKTGEGVEDLLKEVIEKIPPPSSSSVSGEEKCLIFDSFYNEHKGVIAVVRVFSGTFKEGDEIIFASHNNFLSYKIKEVGYFTPEMKKEKELKEGEIGYIATGIKDAKLIKIGDTILKYKKEIIDAKTLSQLALKGFKEPSPTVFVAFYPDESLEYNDLKKSLEKLNLNDSSLKIEQEYNDVLGRGFKVGFLGKLHFEITAERLKREYKVDVVSTFPSVIYKVIDKNGNEIFITRPEELPQNYKEIWEPYVEMYIILPPSYLNQIIPLYSKFRMTDIHIENLGENLRIKAKMPLSELISDFDDQLKSITSGFASFSYKFYGYEKANVEKVDCYVAGEIIPGMSRFLPKESLEKEARKIAEKLKNLLPRQQFAQAIQIKVGGKVIAREDIPALKKLLGNFGKNPGDRTRKMKLWQKQKRGKEKLKSLAKVRIPPHIFKELIKK